MGTPLELAIEVVIRASKGEYNINKHVNKVVAKVKKMVKWVKGKLKRN